MHGTSRGRGAAKRLVALVTIVLLTAMLAPLSASALSFSAAPNVLDRVDANVTFTSQDSPGLAMLYVDGKLAASRATSAPAAFAFRGIPLAPGSHKLRLFVRSDDHLDRTGTRTVVSWRRALPPLLLTPKPNAYLGKSTPVIAKAGAWTTTLKLTLIGRVIATKSCTPGQIIGFGTLPLASGTNTLVLTGSNPVSAASGTFRVKRLDFPWPTCIVIDKSEFRLYWVKDGTLVKIYPIAIGKPSTPTPARTWKVGAKYVYDVWGVYGPRRLRLYKQVGDSFEYTGYGIHGTNEEWVIGTMASHGCIRMYNRDVLELYPQVPLHTMVLTRE
jgi:lipoprotein-anchoring transpeptidase ErfK/SrfK